MYEPFTKTAVFVVLGLASGLLGWMLSYASIATGYMVARTLRRDQSFTRNLPYYCGSLFIVLVAQAYIFFNALFADIANTGGFVEMLLSMWTLWFIPVCLLSGIFLCFRNKNYPGWKLAAVLVLPAGMWAWYGLVTTHGVIQMLALALFFFSCAASIVAITGLSRKRLSRGEVEEYS